MRASSLLDWSSCSLRRIVQRQALGVKRAEHNGGSLPNRTAGSNRQILICRQIVVHMAAMGAAPVALLQKQMLN